MSELKCGDKVEVKEGDFKGAVGIVRKVTEVKKINVQISFIGKTKSLSVELLEKVGSVNKDLTILKAKEEK